MNTLFWTDFLFRSLLHFQMTYPNTRQRKIWKWIKHQIKIISILRKEENKRKWGKYFFLTSDSKFSNLCEEYYVTHYILFFPSCYFCYAIVDIYNSFGILHIEYTICIISSTILDANIIIIYHNNII